MTDTQVATTAVELDGLEQQVRLKRLNKRRHRKLNQYILASKLQTNQTQISRAFNGEDPELLARIARYLDRMERDISERLGPGSPTGSELKTAQG